MKKIFAYAATAVIAAAPAYAEILTPAEALARVTAAATNPGARKIASRTTGSELQPAITFSDGGDAQIYLFAPTEGGMLLVSAESETQALIGYSDNYVSGMELPPALTMMIDFYASEINALRSGNVIYTAAADKEATSSRADGDMALISPICSTRWNQGDPYNRLAPLYNGQRSVTGCVATAMAQVLNTYQYPDRCKGGICSYQWATGGTTLTMNFNNVKLDWANMADTYTSASSSTSKDAVATLMKAVGYATQMNYSPAASGASAYNLIQGLVKYFDYDCSLQYLNRDWFPIDQWQKMIHDELAAGHPMYYDGVTANKEGHAFVIDGYSGNGYFHVNWGWGGLSDGNFLLTALNPDSQGTGGAASADGFNLNQGAIFNLKKGNTTPADQIPLIMFMHGGFKANTTTYRLGNEVRFSFTNNATGIYNGGVYPITSTYISARLTNSKGEVYNVKGQTEWKDIDVLYGYSYIPSITFPTTLPQGDYIMELACYNASTDQYYPLYYPYGTAGPISVNISGDIMTFSKYTKASIKGSNLVAPETIYTGESFNLTATLTNESTTSSYQDQIHAILFDRDKTTKRAVLGSTMASVPAGTSKEISMTLELTDKSIGSGSFDIALLNTSGTVISTPVAVTLVAPEDAANIEASNMTVDNTDKQSVTFTVTVKATDGNFNGPVYIQIQDKGNYSTTTYVGRLRSESIGLPQGTSKTITISGELTDGVVGSDYTAYVYYIKNGTMTEASGRQRKSFTLTDANSAIESINAAVEADAATEYFDLSGRRVANPAKGIYIMRRGRHSQKVSR